MNYLKNLLLPLFIPQFSAMLSGLALMILVTLIIFILLENFILNAGIYSQKKYNVSLVVLEMKVIAIASLIIGALFLIKG
jgi:hypothetical protein